MSSPHADRDQSAVVTTARTAQAPLLKKEPASTKLWKCATHQG